MAMFQGLMTALVTPFRGGEVDLDSLRVMVRRQLEAGVHGLVPLGSTGEAAALSDAECEAVARTVIDETEGQVPVIVGASHNSTAQAVERVRRAKDWGADAALVVMPYYNKPTQAGGLAHFSAVAEVGLPIIVYNVPGRTASNIGPALAAQLAQVPNLAGIKEASGDMSQVMEICEKTHTAWSVLSGEDMLFLPFLASGGRGLISVTSNVAPKAMARIYTRFMAGDLEGARQAQLGILPLIRAMFSTSNPIPVKAACHLLGLCDNELRLPLLPLDAAGCERLRGELDASGLL